MKLKLLCEKQMNFSLFKLFNDCQLISVNTVIEYYKDFEGGTESQCIQMILSVLDGELS